MADPKLERRIQILESEIAALRSKVDNLSNRSAWWEQIAGSFQEDSIYREAMNLGREYRSGQQLPSQHGS